MQNALRRILYWAALFNFLCAVDSAHGQDHATTDDKIEVLGLIHGSGQWRLSDRKGKESPASPQVVSPGIKGSQRALRFSSKGNKDFEGTSAQRAFGPLRGDRVVVEFSVQPSSDLQNLSIAVRGRGKAAAYLQLNGEKKGICQHYDNENRYREVGPFKTDEVNRIRIALNMRTQKIKVWVNGVGGQEYPFRARTSYVDRIDFAMMPNGDSPAASALVDDIVVRDSEGNFIFIEDFERYFPAESIVDSLPRLTVPEMPLDASGVYRLAESVPIYCPVELELSTENPGKNPYIDGPEVVCTVTGESGEAQGKEIKVTGFWDGGNTWRLRFALTAPGRWRLETASSDPALNGKKGEIIARAATREEISANPLRRGFLEASNRVFKLSDGSQFIPVGDSQFSFTEEFYDEEWRAWVDVLHARGLNSFLGMVWLGRYTRAGASPFHDYDPASDQLDLEFFERLDRWVAYANDRGIVMGLGLGGFPADSQIWWARFQNREREDRYFKYIVSRYAAFNVRWLMYGEANETNPPWRVSWDDEVRHKAELVKKADPYRHLIGNHHTSADVKTIDSPYIDYLDYQDGDHENDGANLPVKARKWAQESRGKPVWSEEFWYSAPYYVEKNDFRNEAGTRCLHLNFISGLAYPTLGSLMRAHSTHEGFPPTEAAKANVSLQQYLLENDESLKRFGAFAKFYSGLPLDEWKCVEFDTANKDFTARFGEHFVTYLDSGRTKTVDLSAHPGTYRGTALLIHTDEVVDLGEIAGGMSVLLSLPEGKAGEAMIKLVQESREEI